MGDMGRVRSCVIMPLLAVIELATSSCTRQPFEEGDGTEIGDADSTSTSAGSGSTTQAVDPTATVDVTTDGFLDSTTGSDATTSDGSTAGGSTTGDGLPDVPVLELSFSEVKQFDFGWAAAAGAEHYQLLESAAPGEAFVQVGGDILDESISVTMPLCFRYEASYVLRACNGAGCAESDPVSVIGSLSEAVGYFKASNTSPDDYFGYGIALSGDGNTLAVGAFSEDSLATGIGGDQADDSASASGAVYVFVRNAMGQWSQQAYVKASNTDPNDVFGTGLALSEDGNTLAVAASGEDSDTTGIDGDQADDSIPSSGAVYVFVRDAMDQWSQQAYVKASNSGPNDYFGGSLALSDDGSTLAVAAQLESSDATGVGGDQANDAAFFSGAVYVFVRDAMDQWAQQAYVKASNTGMQDFFGRSVALSGNGSTLVVGSAQEDSDATGIDGDQANDSAPNSGAVYVFVRDAMDQWSQQAYIKASNAGLDDWFGSSVALSDDGNTLAASAPYDDSDATGIGGDHTNALATASGAVHVFVRDGMGQWAQQAYVKASNTAPNDHFGFSVVLSDDGSTLAVAAYQEDGGAVGIDGDQADDSGTNAGAVYVLVRDAMDQWAQQAYVKASNSGVEDRFGQSVALSDDGNTLAVGADYEGSAATGIGGEQADDTMPHAGAVYLF
jgi:hypothetical protein